MQTNFILKKRIKEEDEKKMKDKELNKIMIDENAIKASIIDKKTHSIRISFEGKVPETWTESYFGSTIKKEEWAEMMKNEVLD